VLSSKTISDLAKNLLSASNKLLRDLQTESICKNSILNAQAAAKEASSWMYSVNAFYQKVASEYSEAFPDLAKPLQSALSQIVYSVTSLKDLLREIAVKIEHGRRFHAIITDLMKYPNSIPERKKKQQHLERFLSSDLLEVMNKSAGDDSFDEQLEKMR
jgi:hypothetical protein